MYCSLYSLYVCFCHVLYFRNPPLSCNTTINVYVTSCWTVAPSKFANHQQQHMHQRLRCIKYITSSSSYRLHCVPSHLIASSPARCRVVRPPGNLDRRQSFTIWLIVRFAAPQLQDGSGILRQRARLAAHCPRPVLKRFKFAHRCRGKLKPRGRAVGYKTVQA